MDYFFDPACPWTWLTSRWLVGEAGRRGVEVSWRTFPLVLTVEGEVPAEHVEPLRMSGGFHRVAEALRAAGRATEVGALYTAVGEHVHEQHGRAGPEVVETACAGLGIPGEIAAAADDERWDVAVRASFDEARALVGDDVGSPVLAVDADHLGGGNGGARRAMFGPILSTRPDAAGSAALWDAVLAFIALPEAAELKRGRGITAPLDHVLAGEPEAARAAP